ncbi:GNAT family N-acetyltransferase [Halobacillus sp. HZG1]|uniref:GNAT family N-acetyltransferase n=1 Tax=Halobacillus sp. HZG1 TaxID=3111769 RepID=UPI002DBA421F|nr:GNAT family N-acetyltransferase [Halobacillus sp. HZG1]MEC3884322.1 GNAT family N-acetyltransferase [Halobacillus sp. HZG1]
MELHTERLCLRPYTNDLAERVVELAGDEAVAATTFVPHPYTLEVAEEWIALHKDWIEKGTAYPLAMIVKESNVLVGTMTLRIDGKHHKGELAYWVGKPYWNQGYATEAAIRVVDFGFGELKLNRIWSAAITSNPGSTKVMQKAGLSYEGTLKQDIYHWGEYKDLDVYGRINNKG